MRKTVLFTITICLLALLSIGILIFITPGVSSYLIGKIIGSEVHISRFDYKYADKTIIVGLTDVKMKGKIDGNVGSLVFYVGIQGGLGLKGIICTDFDLRIVDTKGKTRIFPLFSDMFEIKNGKLQYGAKKFTINEIRINDFKPGKTFTFTVNIDNDYWFKGLCASGEGTYRIGLPDLKGNMKISALDLNRFSDGIEGKADINGDFKFEKREFSITGPFEVLGYKEIKESSKPVVLFTERIKGDVRLIHNDAETDIKISRMNFKGTMLKLDLKFDKRGLTHLELDSEDFIDLEAIRRCLNINNLTSTTVDVWNTIHAGKVRIKKLSLLNRNIFNAYLELKSALISYKKLQFKNVDGHISIDNNSLNLSGLRGDFKTSVFNGVSGVIPFSRDKVIDLKGEYTFNLTDVPFLFDVGEFNFRNGHTDGTIALTGSEKGGYTIKGAGQLSNADVVWKKASVTAKGSYEFNNDEIVFDPLILNKGATSIKIKGKWKKRFTDFKIKGFLDISEIKPFFTAQSMEMDGKMVIDLSVKYADDVFAVIGDINMDEVYFLLPGFIKKKSGILSSASIAIKKKDRNVSIDKLIYRLDIVGLNLKGTINDYKIFNFDVALDARDVESVAPLFFLDCETIGGDLELNASVSDLAFPVRRLPYIRGYADIKRGVLRLPWLKETIRDINLISYFKDDVFDIIANDTKFGKNTIKTGVLRIEGTDFPHFSLNINMENLEFDDNEAKMVGDFRIPVIYKNSLLSRAKGDMSFHTKRLKISHLKEGELFFNGFYDNRTLNIDSLKIDSAESSMNLRGSIDFSDPTPHVSIGGKTKNFLGKLILESFNKESHFIEGDTSIYGNIDSSGGTFTELTRNMNGNLAIHSRDGLIKRWNMLSKIFGLLNVSDILRGKSDMAKKGLPYRMMGATFQINDGVFVTKDFIIDSPSMLVTGSGSVNLKKNAIDAVVAVSPLQMLDAMLDKIPVLGNFLRKRDKGVLHVGYNVKGQLENPGVTLNFKDSVGLKTIDYFKRILVLPKEMLE